MTTHILTVKDTSTSHQVLPSKPALHFASTEHHINGEMLVAYIKGDPCTYFESDDDLYTAVYNWSQCVDYCRDGDSIAMNGTDMFYMNGYDLQRLPLKPDYYLASIIDDMEDHQVTNFIGMMNSYHTLGTLRELAKTPNLNEKVAEAKRQLQCEQFDGKHPIKVTTRYVLTDEPLVSPTGFHYEELIFSLNNVFIQTNRLPAHSNLLAYDMEKF